MLAGLSKGTMNNLSSPPLTPPSSQSGGGGGTPRPGHSKIPFQDQPIPVLKELHDQPSCTPPASSKPKSLKTSFYWPPTAELCAKPGGGGSPAKHPPPGKSLKPQLPTSSHASAGSLFVDDPSDSGFAAMPLATPNGRHAAMQPTKRRLRSSSQQPRDHSSLHSGYRSTGCRSRPSSNESWKSCDTFAGMHTGPPGSRADGDVAQLPVAKQSARTAQHARCPAPRAAKRTVSQPLPAQHAQHTRCPAPAPMTTKSTSASTKRSLPRCEKALGTPQKRVSVERPCSSGDMHASRQSRGRQTHDRHASRRRWHSWDVSGLPLPPSRSTNSDESSEKCHSVLSVLRQRSTASAALHSTDLDDEDSEDDAEHEAEGTFRNISFLNLDSSTPSLNEPQPMPAGAFDFDEDEDLQSMPLLQSDPVAPVLPSISDPDLPREFSSKNTDAKGGPDKSAAGTRGNIAAAQDDSLSEQPQEQSGGAANVQLRLPVQLRVGVNHNATDAAESPLRPHVSMPWGVNEAVATIGCGIEELSLYMP